MTDRLVAVDDADYRLPEPLLGALSTDVTSSSTSMGAAVVDAGMSAASTAQGVVYPDGAGFGPISFSALQAAATAASGTNKKVVMAGTITTDQTLVLKSDFDLGQLTINYNGTGVCVQLGDEAVPSHRFRGTFPRVLNVNKSGVGWASVAGSVGIYVVNMNSCAELVVPLVQQFETGLKVYGKNQGNAYNNFFIGHLHNSKVNLLIDAEGDNATVGYGWSNQHTFYGGRYGHNGAEGKNQPGVRHIKITKNGWASGNNITFITPSVEGACPEYHLDIDSIENVVINGRYEGEAGFPVKVIWRSGAGRNALYRGYNLHEVVEVFEAGGTQNQNQGQTNKLRTAFDVGSFVLENPQANTRGLMTFMAAGAALAGSDPLTAYVARLTANSWMLKQATDANPTVVIDPVNKRIHLGGGVGAPTYGIQYASSGTQILGHLLFEASRDIGLSTGSKPRNIRASNFIEAGQYTTAARPAMTSTDRGSIWDITLGIPIWWNGTAWINAMGTVV